MRLIAVLACRFGCSDEKGSGRSRECVRSVRFPQHLVRRKFVPVNAADNQARRTLKGRQRSLTHLWPNLDGVSVNRSAVYHEAMREVPQAPSGVSAHEATKPEIVRLVSEAAAMRRAIVLAREHAAYADLPFEQFLSMRYPSCMGGEESHLLWTSC